MALTLILACVILPVIAVISYLKFLELNIPQEMFVLSEFYSGVRDTKFALTYTSAVLIRRSLFVTILMFLSWVPIHVFYPVLLIIQIIYMMQVIIIRHFKQASANIIEIVNEIILFVVMAVFYVFTSEHEWDGDISKTLKLSWCMVSLITANSVIIVIIVISEVFI